MKLKKRNERKKEVDQLYKRIKTMPPTKRVQSVSSKEGQYWMNLLTPSQFAELFPTYYKKQMPDVGLTLATSGAVIRGGQTPLMGGAGASKVQGAPGTASAVPSGGGGRGKFNPRGAPSAEPSPPDPLKILKKSIEDKSGVKIADPSFGSLSQQRSSFSEELKTNPGLRASMAAMAISEVGPNADEASIRGVMETMANRAAAQGKSLDWILKRNPQDERKGVNYYAPYDDGAFDRNLEYLKKNPDALENINKRIDEVMAGSNDSKLATDNSSADVAAGARQTQTVTTVTDSGETLSRKDRPEYDGQHGAGWQENNRKWVSQTEEAMRLETERRRNVPQSGSTDINAYPLTPITKPIGMNEELTKLWDTFKTPEQQAKFVEALQKLAQEGKAGVDVANDMAKTAPKQNGVPQIEGELIHEDQKTQAAIRRGEIKPELKEQLQFAAEKSGVQVEVVSGGQRMEGAPGATGSHRHDHGGAADLKLFRVDENGKRQYLSMSNPEDQALMKQFAKDAVKAGATGIGAGHGYMGENTMHIGGGSETHWGGAEWIGEAQKEGIKERNAGEFEAWKKKKLEDAEAAKAEAINKKQQAVPSGTTDINAYPLTPDTPPINTTPVPLADRGITTQAGHTAPAPEGAPTGTATPTAPTVTPTPAPTPPTSSAPTSTAPPAPETPGEPGPLKGSQQGEGIKPQSSATPAANVPNKVTDMADHEPLDNSQNRAYANIRGNDRPGETGTTTYKT